MFESVFYEASKRRAQQAALDTYKASLEYQQVRRDNPTMLDATYVDFSNPESVARMQTPILNPYGTYNPYANPNLVMQNAGYNPTFYASSSYGGGSWYGGGWGGYDTRFMIPSPDDKTIPIGEVVHGTPKPIERRRSYMDKLTAKPVVVVFKGSQEPTSSKKQDANPHYRVVSKPKYHPPMTPYTIEELDPDRGQLKLITDTPLEWTTRDNEELERLVDDLSVYDKAMAHVAYNVPHIDGCTREDWTYIKRYFQDRIQDFRSKELMNQGLDYRAKYRYRRLPATTIIDGESMPDLTKPIPIPTKQISLTGEVVYDYDRGRDMLTEEEWDIFVDRAYGEMMKGAEQIKAQDLMQLNQHLSQQPSKKQEDTRYNPYDPISVRLHSMRQSQKAYTTNMNFFKHVFRHRLTPEQFDNWWYGTQSNAVRYSGKQVDQATAQQMWAKQMSEANYSSLLQFRPYDKDAVRNWMNQKAIEAINNYTKGTVTKDMSLADFMRNLRYLDTRNHELNLEAQQKANQQAMWNNMSHDTFSRSLYQYMNSPSYSNPNPYYTPQYGTIDPRFGMPNQFIDLTNNPLAQQKKQQFLQHCHTVSGHVPLSPIYR